MQAMRTLFLIALVGSTAVSSASFDLLFVADNGTGTPATRTIRRYDPVTGAALGSFGSAPSDWRAVCVVPSLRRVYAATVSSGVYGYDMDSGELVMRSAASFYSMRLDASGTRVLVGTTNQVLSVDPATLGSGTIALGASLGLSGGLRAVQGTFASSYAAFDPATNQVWGVNSAGTALGSFISFGAQNMRDLFYVGVGRSQVGMLSDGGGTSSYSFATVSSTGAIGVVASAGMTSYFTTMHAGAAAHTGAYILGSDGTGARGLARISAIGGFPGEFHAMPGLVNPVAMDTFLAPEPGTWAALGLGLVALARRRRK